MPGATQAIDRLNREVDSGLDHVDVDGRVRPGAEGGGPDRARLADVVAEVGARSACDATPGMEDVRALVAFAVEHLPAGHSLRRFDGTDPAVVIHRVLGRLASALPELPVPDRLARPFTRDGVTRRR